MHDVITSITIHRGDEICAHFDALGPRPLTVSWLVPDTWPAGHHEFGFTAWKGDVAADRNSSPIFAAAGDTVSVTIEAPQFAADDWLDRQLVEAFLTSERARDEEVG